MGKLTRFESLAERLVEGTFARLFAGRLRPAEVAAHIVRAMEDQQVSGPGGMPQIPTHYRVFLHPDDHRVLALEKPYLAEELSRHVTELAIRAGLLLDGLPVVDLQPSPDIPLHQVRVEAQWPPAEDVGRTREIAEPDAVSDEAAAIPPRGQPFLIVTGQRHIDLVQAVVSIGRALDNDVIIEDTRVSRHHAQLRRRYGRYVLYDLGSAGGTQINGYPVEECVLQSGDVISLAGVQIIYGEDPPPPVPPRTHEDTPLLVTADDS